LTQTHIFVSALILKKKRLRASSAIYWHAVIKRFNLEQEGDREERQSRCEESRCKKEIR
jgi:hypothetical protein